MPLDTGNALITLAEFKKYIGQSTGSTSYDERYINLINQSSIRFNNLTNRLLKSRSITEYRDGDGDNALYTNQWPIVSNSTNIDIRIDTDRAYTSTDFPTTDKVDSTSIIIYSTKGMIKLKGKSFSAGDQSIKLTYTAGYSTIPEDLKYACMEHCRLMWKRETSNQIGIKSQSVEGGTVSYEEDMPWSIKRIIDMYKRADHQS